MYLSNSKNNRTTGKQAVVIGASMAGLLAARVLSDYFEQVTVIERDTLSDSPEPRKGAPQGNHVHGLLSKGAEIMEKYFPGLFAELLRDGAISFDMGAEAGWFHYGRWKNPVQSGITVYCQSRPFLEWKIRRRVAALTNVEIIDNCEINRLFSSPDRERITGVQLQRRQQSQETETIVADLVVDASGRGSRAPQWLEALGYGTVAEETVKINVGYASRVFQKPASFQSDWKMLLVYAHAPKDKRMGGIFPIEQSDRWMVTLIGCFKDYPPTDDANFLEFARTLPQPDLYEAIREAEPLTPIAQHKLPSSQWRHYEKLASFPEGLVVLGDALCSFNPIYGQGMTTAALGVEALEKCLKAQPKGKGVTGLADKFRKQVAKVVAAPWLLATSEDLRYPEAEGKRPFGLKTLHWYSGRLYERSAEDGWIFSQFLQVMHMFKSPASLFAPRMLYRVLGPRPKATKVVTRAKTATQPLAAGGQGD